MNLYAGKILLVDLTAKQITVESLKAEWLKDYWGGWGLALRYYWNLVSPEVDPSSPENPMVIMTGPFCGTLVPLTSRFCLVSKSPYTGTVFESNAGGAFGPELKYAGYDGIIITGRADSWTYLKIDDDRVSLEDADALIGKGTFETEQLLKDAMHWPEAKTLTIGPAGENQIGYACVGTESYRQFGRGGAGALFGNKKLKGIVCRGTGALQVADMSALIEKIGHYKTSDLFTDANLWAQSDGTAVLIDGTNEMGLHPTRNFTYGVNEDKDRLNSDAIKAAKLGNRACSSCPMACGKFTHINDAEMEGPEYETLCLAGSNCEINDLEAVIRFNRLCDDMGLDTISCGNTVGLAMEISEEGYHDFNLRFGRVEEYLAVVKEIAELSTDRGRDLALGAKKLAAKYNAQELTTEIKGLEFPAYEPRANYGMGLSYATSERGACHMRAFTVGAEDPFNLEAMAKAVAAGQDHSAIKWCMCLCDFWGTVSPEIMADLLSIGLGEKVDAKQLRASGEKIWNLTRLFNLRAGFTAEDDALPSKIMKQPLQKGPHAGKVFTEEDFESAKQIYYRMRGWDANGVPTTEKLAQLGLDQMIFD